jgi:hypothetical protein
MHRAILALVLSCTMLASTMFQTGCTAQQKLAVVQEINTFIPVVTNVGDAICDFDHTAAICIGAVNSVSASAQILVTALTNYYQAEANGTVPPGILSALSNAINQFEGDASNILGAIHVLDQAHQQLIEGLAAAASALLAVIESTFPSLAGAQLRFQASRPPTFNLTGWVKDYNAKVATLEKSLPRNSKKLARVHAHGLAARLLTAGILK